MKIAIGYPPLESKKGVPQVSQNRQFQWTASGPMAYFIYPVVPASAATLLKSKGYDVVWLDGLAEKWSYQEWLDKVKKEKPDLIMMETKTPVIKSYWRVIKNLKSLLTPRAAGIASGDARHSSLLTVLVGDHVTALPEESMENSPVDYILTGGDYDFLLLNLVEHLTKGEKLESGIWYRKAAAGKTPPRKNPSGLGSSTRRVGPARFESRSESGGELAGLGNAEAYGNTGHFILNHDLDKLPMIDRDLTKWHLYAYKNSNFYRVPGAYTMFGRDCWWGKCTFCSWTTLYPGKCYRSVKVEKALDEVGRLIEDYGAREIMDDSGTFPTGDWLREFCEGMIKKGYNKKARINCNMRFNANLDEKDYQLMGKAGFRFVLYGLESASQETLVRINKNLKVEQIEPVLGWAKKAGLMPHLTVMVGYPWEDEKDVKATIALAEMFFKKGLADSLQATIVIPYPGTPLFDYCDKKGLLKTKNWDEYDMREPIMKTRVPDEKLLAAVRSLYSRSIWTPRFLLNTLSQLKSIDGIKYVGFQALKYFGKLWEFK